MDDFLAVFFGVVVAFEALASPVFAFDVFALVDLVLVVFAEVVFAEVVLALAASGVLSEVDFFLDEGMGQVRGQRWRSHGGQKALLHDRPPRLV